MAKGRIFKTFHLSTKNMLIGWPLTWTLTSKGLRCLVIFSTDLSKAKLEDLTD